MKSFWVIVFVLLMFNFVRKITAAGRNNPAATKVLVKGLWGVGSRFRR